MTDAMPDLARRRWRSLLRSASLHHITGRALADGVDGRHAEVVEGVRAETAHAVAGGGDTIDLLVGVIRCFRTVLKAARGKAGRLFQRVLFANGAETLDLALKWNHASMTMYQSKSLNMEMRLHPGVSYIPVLCSRRLALGYQNPR